MQLIGAQQEVMVSSVFGTNTIEGGALTKEETTKALQLPQNAKGETELRATNIRPAHDEEDQAIRLPIP